MEKINDILEEENVLEIIDTLKFYSCWKWSKFACSQARY
jgi:hypothetical protein